MSILDKTLGEYLLIFIFSLILVFIYLLIFKNNDCDIHKIDNTYGTEVKNNKYPTWNRTKCEYLLSSTITDELSNNNIQYSENNWNLYLPCGYDYIDKEIEQLPIINNAKYFIISGADEMVAKEWLWTHVVHHYGLNIALTMMPNSYVLYNPIERLRFNADYNDSKIYIMKKNIQRQEGLKITKDKNEILNGHTQGYVLVQELLQDPYIINGRKTNMRFYVLVVCDKGALKVYVHKDGFMYYTKELFAKYTTDTDTNITTGYVDRKIYEENPLTHDDLRQYLDDPKRTKLLIIENNIRNQKLKISDIYFDRIYKLLSQVFMAFVGKICKSDKLLNNTSFQLFGVDIAVNDKLNPMIMEINKGPDLGAKDKKDSDLKHGVIKDTFAIVNVIKGDTSKFIKVLDVLPNGSVNHV
jgi:hypothetical protein